MHKWKRMQIKVIVRPKVSTDAYNWVSYFQFVMYAKGAARGKGNCSARVHVCVCVWGTSFGPGLHRVKTFWTAIFLFHPSSPFVPSFGLASCYHCCVSKSQWRNKTLPTNSSSNSSRNANVYAATGLTWQQHQCCVEKGVTYAQNQTRVHAYVCVSAC